MDKKTLKRKLKFIENYINASNAATGSKYDANANVTQKNVSTLQCELGKKDLIEINRALTEKYLKKLYGRKWIKQFRRDLKNHIIYSHDESSIFPYCCSISMYPFILNGLKDLGGSSDVPKHTNSYIGGCINLIFLIASQFAGALALPEWLTFFDYYLRKDFGNDYINLLDDDKLNIRHQIEDWFQQFVYSINQPAGARNYQSPFINIAYFDKYYFESIFKDFIFPDGDEPCWETTKELQKMFMKWFNKERTKEIITFPVETFNILVENGKYKDEETADFISECWAEGHSFFCYQSDSVDALASCCFSKDQMVLARSNNRGVSKIYFDTFENIGKTLDGPNRNNFYVYHNGSWCQGKKIKLQNRPMYKIVTSNNKEIIVSDNHLNPTSRGDIETKDLTLNDYLLFSVRELDSYPEQDLHLTYEQGFVVGAFLGDGSFGSIQTLSDGTKTIYDINFSLSINKYAKCIDMINKANSQLGGETSCRLNEIYNNVYPVRISSKVLVDFISRWTNWKRGTYSYNKELNMECLLQSKEFRQGILDGWYKTDGGNNNRCYTTSKKLVDCMEVLITSLGKCSIIDKIDNTNNLGVIRGQEIKHNYPLYCVRWYDMKNKRTMKDVYKVINNSVYFKIKSIERVEYNDDIYCFEMKNLDEPYFTLPNGIITHNCRLRNEVEENVFSYTLGAGGVKTGSKKVITLNLNRIIQDWYRKSHRLLFKYKGELSDYIRETTNRVHKYLNAWNEKLWDDFNNDMLSVYKAGFIDLDKQFLTIGVNGFVEAAEFLKSKNYDIEVDPFNEGYKKLARDILGTIKELNKEHRDKHHRYNTEFVPAENVAGKFYNWDKEDGYIVPKGRVLYNSYFYIVEDETIDPVKKFYYQGNGFATECDGGVANHVALDSHLSKKQYRKLMDIAVKAGCNYWTYNIPNTICNDCGHIDKRMLTECPKCHSKNIDYATRIIGYLKRVSNFSEIRQKEASQRAYYHINESDKLE